MGRRKEKLLLGIVRKKRRWGVFIPFKEGEPSFLIPKSELRGKEDGVVALAKVVKKKVRKRYKEFGEIEKVLGDFSDMKVATTLLLYKYKVKEEFTKKVLKEAKRLKEFADKKSLQNGRRDLTNLLTFTIDGDDARDFDDAVSIERRGDDYVLYVSIADVSNYVKPKSSIDTCARERGNSIYFPDRAVHMLPERLSCDLCSLSPLKSRPCLTVEVVVGKDGERKEFKIYESFIRSRARLTYREVEEFLQTGKSESIDPDIKKALLDMFDLSRILRERRKKIGSLFIDLPEAKFLLEDGRVKDIRLLFEERLSREIIEEFMILANETVAVFLREKGILPLYRIHEEPSLEKMEELRFFLKNMGYNFDNCSSKRDFYLKVLKTVCGQQSPFVSQLILRSLKQAKYSFKNVGHFGLGLEEYLHFTSPIRRYADLFVHRMVKGAFCGVSCSFEDELLAEHLSQVERLSTEIERESEKIAKLFYLKEKIGETFVGFVTNFVRKGFFVELKDVPIDGFVPYSWVSKKALKKIKIGTEVLVVIDDVDPYSQRVDLFLKSIIKEPPHVKN